MSELFWFCVIMMIVIAFWGVVVAVLLGAGVIALVLLPFYVIYLIRERKARDSNPEGN